MNISALTYFFQIVQGETFLNVAEENNTSQSSVSKAIQRLEADIGVKLFDRSSRSVKLTPAGASLYEDLKRISPLYNEMMKKMQNFARTKVITCCAIPQFSIFRLNYIIGQFMEENANILVEQHAETDIQKALSMLLAREYDFVIMRQPIGNYGDIEYTFLAEDRMLAVFPKHHALSTKETVTIEDLKGSGSKIILDSCMSSVVTDLAPVIGRVPHSASNTLIRRQDMLVKISSGVGISLYFSDDVSVFKLNNVIAVPINGVPRQPLVIASAKKNSLPKEHKALRQYLSKSIERITANDGI